MDTGGKRKDDVVRYQNAKALDTKIAESLFNHEGIREPLTALKHFTLHRYILRIGKIELAAV